MYLRYNLSKSIHVFITVLLFLAPVVLCETWSTLSTTGTAPIRSDFGSGVIYNDALYIIGGTSGASTVYDTTFKLDLTTDTWSELESMGDTEKRKGHFVTLLNDKIYTFHGISSFFLTSVLSYNIAGNTWSTLSPSGSSPTERVNPCGCSYSNRYAVIFGGTNGGGLYYNDVTIYDSSLNRWLSVTVNGGSPPQMGLCSCSYNSEDGKVYCHGGEDSGGSADEFFSLDITSLTSTTAIVTYEALTPDATFTASNRAVVVSRGRILLLGGFTDIAPSYYEGSTLEFDPILDAWRSPPITNTFTASSGGFAFEYDDKLHLYGGKSRFRSLSEVFVTEYLPRLTTLGYYSTNGDETEVKAPRGKYADSTRAYEPTVCPLGSYQNIKGQSSCVTAPLGYYCGSTGTKWLSDCDECSAGSYGTTTGRWLQSQCASCEAGYFCEGITHREACPEGTSSSATEATSSATCSDCQQTDKQYQPNTGQSSCITVDDGYYVTSDAATSQTICPEGSYCTPTGGKEVCDKGFYADSTGMTECTGADPGYYVDSTESNVQTECPSGTANPDSESTSSASCVACDADKFCAAGACSTCSLIPKGSYADGNGITYTACPSGTYNELEGGTTIAACVDCPGGTYNPSTGGDAFDACLDVDLNYYAASGSSSQTACPDGYYSVVLEIEGVVADSIAICDVCPANTKSLAGNNCTDCGDGFYSFEGASSCLDCAGNGTACLCESGQYATVWSNGTEYCETCNSGYYCLAGIRKECPEGAFSFGGASKCTNTTEMPGWRYHTANRTILPCTGITEYYNETTEMCDQCLPGNKCHSSHITPCPLGFFSEEGGLCEPCLPGTYAPSTGMSGCTACTGNQTSAYGRSYCLPCLDSETAVDGICTTT
ncbi:hypothetical protein PCE1_000471 [Barthelona sp. PCE]